ncbi:MAG: hypothetical protein A4E45_01769 [Methanosaeta sp. PtaB.Bin039]|nr:MAG: hypothetical protein A4E45_01769 [Methanosaeta sp. PtaB.Bin039]
MATLKLIADFHREDQAAVIELFMQTEDPQAHVEAIRSLVSDGAIIQSADADNIRAVYRGVGQDKLISLLDDGWSFTGQPQGGLEGLFVEGGE